MQHAIQSAMMHGSTRSSLLKVELGQSCHREQMTKECHANQNKGAPSNIAIAVIVFQEHKL